MQKILFLKVLCLSEIHITYLAFHAAFAILGAILSVYSILYLLNTDIPISITFTLFVYLISFIFLLLLLSSLSYELVFNADKLVIRNFTFKSYELKLNDSKILIGIRINRFLGNIIITYDNRLIFKFISLSENVEKIRNTLLKNGYRKGGIYKVCKLCGSVNDLDDNKCEICGSTNLYTYDLLWVN
ncbi:hypothetical protein [Saccharolobus caldissimus]|uniref:Uncharacterized protein n=1 Tax=Saccharolobus caldissimus TaxID=1702097 RepID=A0AAQ4CS41_9CREN|nr:hypothetical protein [Saccharolobus caldissimus]BDB98622.1 hypothetical protein SACC_16390 [Saccharolobus caldissimus]